MLFRSRECPPRQRALFAPGKAVLLPAPLSLLVKEERDVAKAIQVGQLRTTQRLEVPAGVGSVDRCSLPK